jgi:hypothetical protein
MQIFCNYTLVQFPFFFSCSHRNKPADFAMGHFSFLQSLTTQACNHIPNNQVALQANRQSQVSIFATHITTGCNHVCRIVAITHWLSYFFSFFFQNTRKRQLQWHCYKGASNHLHLGFATVVSQLLHIRCCNRMFWMLQSPIFFSQGCNHIKQTPT